ncbi:hypothetical protein DB88DRAFT_487980 [Papiliotrema laurentii]|uniref:DUF788-domain-containing protein n=1 Tax=Papiliotrema laurentii TaxID=5418 RepID=A0AAD9FS30_PAPLA|nr:hypothetical protein DB88DRAFT_487980 [Papiliotrema laurentii]
MAKASDKRIAQSNEKALHNLQLGLLIVNLLTPALRYIFSLITSRKIVPSRTVLLLHVLTLAGSLLIYRWFKTIATPRLDSRGVRAGDDLSGKGIVELAWDVIYMTWICTLGSAILGDWVWWFLLLIPGFGTWKAFSTIRPILAMFLPGWFGPKAPKQPGDQQPQEEAKEAGESKRQAKLRARAEKGDKRVQQVQRR